MLARIFVLEKEYGKALENLRSAVRLDTYYKEKAKYDIAFDNIRNLNEFNEIVNN
jgi:hypothetical protein